jgi:hypothetical protein
MNDIVNFGNAKLPSVQNLSAALRSLEHEVGGSGMAILKMDKTGHWVFGADQTEIEEDSQWAVNPFSFVHGFIAWGDGDVLGEKMVPVADPLPEMDVAPPGAKRGWELQVGLCLKCMSSEDKGLEVTYNVTSVGGKRAVQKLALDIAAQVEKDQTKPVAIVRLKKEHYTHKSYGRIYTPILEIVSWMGLNGQADEKPASEAPADAPTRRRRSA